MSAMLEQILNKLNDEEKAYLDELIEFTSYPQLIRTEEDDTDLRNENEVNTFVFQTGDGWTSKFQSDLFDFVKTIEKDMAKNSKEYRKAVLKFKQNWRANGKN